MFVSYENVKQFNRNWEYVRVVIHDYRTMGDPSFAKHFRLTKDIFEVSCQKQHILADVNMF